MSAGWECDVHKYSIAHFPSQDQIGNTCKIKVSQNHAELYAELRKITRLSLVEEIPHHRVTEKLRNRRTKKQR